ncbi:MAG: hypothetical protein JRJ03_15710 [Deltaproteobacteria bacterium]|nr:hypothetical protein [Deltaproteobacteria bacterium]MBW2066356.1 hypothetical protein [Deltaproteobacteria bacterium]
MKRFRIGTLQQRMVFLLLLPLGIFLFGLGFFGFVFTRNVILREWREASVLKLERAAQFIDMRLEESLSWIERFKETGSMRSNGWVQDWMLDQLRSLDGVAKVELHMVRRGWRTSPDAHEGPNENGGRSGASTGWRTPRGP